MLNSLSASAFCAALLVGCAAEPTDLDGDGDAEASSFRGGDGDGGGAGDGDGDDGVSSEVKAEAEATVCSREEHIAFRTDGTCATIGSWVGSSLFDDGTPWLATDLQAPPDALSKFCRYTWSGVVEPTDLQIAGLYNNADIEDIGASCVAVSAQADAMTDALGETLRELFRVHTGQPSSVDLGLPLTGSPLPTVTVMVVDTHPDSEEAPTTTHGRHMGQIVADTGCPDGVEGCRVEVGYATGLPRISGRVADYVHGGIVGTHEDLALGIYEAMRRWEEANVGRDEPSRLVINLSLGWEATIFGGFGADRPTPIDAVYAAMNIASCKGALIVASVGNESDFCGVTGPMLPGGWETLPAPDAAACNALGVVDPAVPAGSTNYRPLVHAVGGMAPGFEAMPQSRDGADPRMVAVSTNAVVGNPMRAGLTGTSVGAAAVSGAAALVWSYQPHLDGSEIMDMVYDAASPAGLGKADFAVLGTPLPEVRQVDACAALDHACTDANNEWICPGPMPLACLNAASPTAADLLADLSTVTPGISVVAPALIGVDSSCTDACGNPVEIQVAPGQSADCTALEVHPTEKLLNPTPDDISCPTCGFTSNVATLSLSLDADYNGEPIDGVIVTLDDGLGDKRRLDLGVPTLSSFFVTEIVLDSDDLPTGAVRTGEITIDYTNRRTTNDALIIM